MEEEKPVETTEKPVKTRGCKPQSKEHMASIAKLGAEVNKKRGAINAYEKAQKRKEIDEKFAMIQAEIEKTKITNETKPPEIQIPEPIPVVKNTAKPKKVIEIIEEQEDEESEEEEEVIVKRIIKKKHASLPRNNVDNNENFIRRSNIEMLKTKFNDDIKKRLMSSLFD